VPRGRGDVGIAQVHAQNDKVEVLADAQGSRAGLAPIPGDSKSAFVREPIAFGELVKVRL
jgi:hypothetical protein